MAVAKRRERNVEFHYGNPISSFQPYQLFLKSKSLSQISHQISNLSWKWIHK